MKIHYLVKKLLGQPTSLFEIFHEKTKQDRFKKKRRQNNPLLWSKVYFKSYPRLEKIILPPASELKKTTLVKALYSRRSLREFSSQPLTLEQISDLLYYSAGLKKITSNMQTNRFYPSGGSRYPLETYLISLNSELPLGIYHYEVKNHTLAVLDQALKINWKDYFTQDFVGLSSCIVIQTAVFERTTLKYGDRGYRLILMEAGYLGQNLSLVSAALNIGCCALGGYYDDPLAKLLEIDSFKEAIINIHVLGHKK